MNVATSKVREEMGSVEIFELGSVNINVIAS